jgi:hypothetical protein
MTIRMYKRITNLAFVLGTIAVVCFDSFRNPLIPGLVLIGAGLVAGATHIGARSMRLSSGEQSIGGEPLGDPPGNAKKEMAAQKNAPPERVAQQAEAERRASDYEALFIHHRTHRVYFMARPQPIGPDLRAVETAVAVAKALSPEPTDYEVILTADGTLRIRPLSRIPEAQLFEEQRRHAIRAGRAIVPESKFVQ